jgi:hypothetical protein
MGIDSLTQRFAFATCWAFIRSSFQLGGAVSREFQFVFFADAGNVFGGKRLVKIAKVFF